MLGFGRVPSLSARILRALDAAHLLGHGLRIVGTHALYAYEAAAGVRLAPEVTATDDIALLFDSRASLVFLADEDLADRSPIGLLRRVDRSFERTRQTFRATNRDGLLVDLIRPMRSPPWASERGGIADTEADLDAVQIEGLVWSESAPTFPAVAIDEGGFPVRIVAPDPRAFAVHKRWMARRADRDPLKRARDAAQARAAARLVSRYLPPPAVPVGGSAQISLCRGGGRGSAVRRRARSRGTLRLVKVAGRSPSEGDPLTTAR